MRNGEQMQRTLLVGLYGLLLAIGGCGDDGNGGKLSTGVDKSKPLGMVTPTEAEQICKSTELWARKAFAESKQRELTCKITALALVGAGVFSPDAAGTSDAQLQMTCVTTRDQCLAAATPGDPGGSAAMCEAFPAGCTATVAEYEACLNDVPPFVDSTAAKLPSCETVNRLSLLALVALANDLPMSCRTFQTKCGGAGIPGIPGVPTAP
jgi:hypothetical protein